MLPSDLKFTFFPPPVSTVKSHNSVTKAGSSVSLVSDTIRRKGSNPQSMLLRGFWGTSGCTNLPCLALAFSWLHMNKLWPMTCVPLRAWHHAQADKPLWEHAQLAKQTGDHISLCIWPHQYTFKDPFIAYKKILFNTHIHRCP